MRKLSQERIDLSNITIHNESNKLPGHEDRIKEHCERIQREYFNKGLNCAGRPKRKQLS